MVMKGIYFTHSFRVPCLTTFYRFIKFLTSSSFSTFVLAVLYNFSQVVLKPTSAKNRQKNSSKNTTLNKVHKVYKVELNCTVKAQLNFDFIQGRKNMKKM